MRRDVSKDKNFDRVLIRISYELLTGDENFDLNHQKAEDFGTIVVCVTYV